MLIQGVADWARARAASELRLAVADGNAAATALYQRNDFVRFDTPPKAMPDGVRCEYVMAKQL